MDRLRKNMMARLVVLALSLALSFPVSAASLQGQVLVELISAFTFVERNIVDFNTIPRVDGVCTMNKQGRLGGTCAGYADGTIGEMEIQGTAKQWVTVAVTQLQSVDGVTYTPKLASNSGSSDSVRLDKVGKAVIDVIGDLTLSNPSGGLKNLNYLININYE